MSPRCAGTYLEGAAGFRPALVGLLARISHRNGRDPVCPDFRNAPHPAPKVIHCALPRFAGAAERAARAVYAALSAWKNRSGMRPSPAMQTACIQSPQNRTAIEHCCSRGLTPLVEIREFTENAAVCSQSSHFAIAIDLRSCMCCVLAQCDVSVYSKQLVGFENRQVKTPGGVLRGSMRPDLRDKLIDRFEERMRWAGAKDWDEGTEDFLRLLEALREKVLLMKTKEDLAALLDQMPNPSWWEQKLLFGFLKHLPEILRVWAVQIASGAEKLLPAPPGGRPPVDLQRQVEIIMYVGQLHTDHYSMEISKKRAAAKFGISESTVQRIWDDRGSIDEADFRSAANWITEERSSK